MPYYPVPYNISYAKNSMTQHPNIPPSPYQYSYVTNSMSHDPNIYNTNSMRPHHTIDPHTNIHMIQGDPKLMIPKNMLISQDRKHPMS